MVKKLILSVAIIILAIFLGMFLSWQYSATRTPAAQPEGTYSPSGSAAQEQENEPVEPAPGTPSDEEPASPGEISLPGGYYLRDHEGRIAVFPAGSDIPELVFDVYTRMLPQSDQDLLQQGVYVADYEELTRLVEDYIS